MRVCACLHARLQQASLHQSINTASHVCRLASTFAHYATLVVASDPVRQHQEYKAEQVMPHSAA